MPPMPSKLRVCAIPSSNGRLEARWPAGDMPSSALDGAASAIAAASGNLTAGDTLHTETFEALTVGVSPDGATWPSGGKWGNGVGSAYASVETTRAYSGSKSCRIAYQAEVPYSDGCPGQLTFDLGGSFREVTINWKLWVPSNWKHRSIGGAGTNNKLIRLWPDDGGDGSAGYGYGGKVGFSMWRDGDTSSRLIADVNRFGDGIGPQGAEYADFLTASDRGTWVDIEVYFKAPTASVSGVQRVKKNGVTCVNNTTITDNYYSGEPNSYRFGYLMGWANTGFDEETLFFIDDVVPRVVV